MSADDDLADIEAAIDECFKAADQETSCALAAELGQVLAGHRHANIVIALASCIVAVASKTDGDPDMILCMLLQMAKRGIP